MCRLTHLEFFFLFFLYIFFLFFTQTGYSFSLFFHENFCFLVRIREDVRKSILCSSSGIKEKEKGKREKKRKFNAWVTVEMCLFFYVFLPAGLLLMLMLLLLWKGWNINSLKSAGLFFSFCSKSKFNTRKLLSSITSWMKKNITKKKWKIYKTYK